MRTLSRVGGTDAGGAQLCWDFQDFQGSRLNLAGRLGTSLLYTSLIGVHRFSAPLVLCYLLLLPTRLHGYQPDCS